MSDGKHVPGGVKDVRDFFVNKPCLYWRSIPVPAVNEWTMAVFDPSIG
jgi:hypothetical protein